jgi:hypothetical protein
VRVRVPSPERASLVGTIVWLVGVTVLELGQLPSLVVLSPLVLHPLIIGHANTEAVAPRLHTLVRWLQLPAATLVAVGFGQPAGTLAAALALPWFVVTSLTALLGVMRLRQRGFMPVHELSIDAGLIALAGGGAWAVASCAGYQPLSFSPTIVLLAAAHFHYAAFVLPVLCGLGVRRVDRPYTRWIPIAILAGYPLVAVGITVSPIVEVVGAIVLAVGAIGCALVQLSVAASAKHRVASLLLACSALALLWGISLAGIYAVGEFRGLPWPSIPEMVSLHGSVNALGFGLLGTWAWTLEARRSG